MTRARARHRTMFFFISDSLSLRHRVKSRYGDKLFADTGTRAEHMDCYHQRGACTKPHMTRAMRHAAADLLAFSMAYYHVYTATSGFGRLGAWLSFG